MGLFGQGALPPELIALIGRRRVLAKGRNAEGPVFGFADQLAYQRGDAWQAIGWHEIERGGWDAKSQQLTWTGLDGEETTLALDAPGRLPQLFRERVEATIVYNQSFTFEDGLTSVISARRSLSDPRAPLSWQVRPSTGTSAAQVADSAVVQAELARLRAEYDGG